MGETMPKTKNKTEHLICGKCEKIVCEKCACHTDNDEMCKCGHSFAVQSSENPAPIFSLMEIESEFCDTFIDSRGAKRIQELMNEAYHRGRDAGRAEPRTFSKKERENMAEMLSMSHEGTLYGAIIKLKSEKFLDADFPETITEWKDRTKEQKNRIFKMTDILLSKLSLKSEAYVRKEMGEKLEKIIKKKQIMSNGLKIAVLPIHEIKEAIKEARRE